MTAIQRLGRSGAGTLLERYLERLLGDPLIRGLAADGGREGTLQWAEDELRSMAATLVGLTLEEAEYELTAVLNEARARLGLVTDDVYTSAA